MRYKKAEQTMGLCVSHTGRALEQTIVHLSLQHLIQFYYMTALAFVPLLLPKLIKSPINQVSPTIKLLFRIFPSRVCQCMLACSFHA